MSSTSARVYGHLYSGQNGIMVGAKNGQQCHYDASSSSYAGSGQIMHPSMQNQQRSQTPHGNVGMTSNHSQLCHRQVTTLNKPDPSRISSSLNCSSRANYQSTDWPNILILTRGHYASTVSIGDTSVSTVLVRTSYWLTRKPQPQQNRLYQTLHDGTGRRTCH